MANSDNVLAGAGGKVYFAPAGTTVPTDASTAPDVAFNDHGHISEDGVTEGNSKSTTNILNWEGAVVRTIVNEQEFTLQVTFLETNPEVLKSFYADESATAAAWVVAANQGRRGSWIVDAVDGTKTRRLVVEDGQVTDTGDVTSATSDAIAYQITITCYPGTGGAVYRGYIHDTAA